MNKTQLLALALMCLLLAPSLPAQQPQQPAAPATPAPTPQREADDADDVVRITTNLVQVDASVTDKNGRVVTDLRAEDFEVLEDGRPQTITNLSFVALEPSPAEAASVAPANASRDKNAPPLPTSSAPARPEQVRRTMALVAGNLSFSTTNAVRDALKKYVAELVQPNDLVAVISLYGTNGALSRFTTDRRQLERAAAKIRWFPSGSEESDEAAARGEERYRTGSALPRDPVGELPRGAGGVTLSNAEIRATRDEIEGTVGGACQRDASLILALTQVVRGMQPLPGRKSLVFFSNGLSIYRGNGLVTNCIQNALRLLVDAAARSSVVIYTIDARGVLDPSGTSAEFNSAADNTSARSSSMFESRNGLNYLADNTGGRFIQDKNDLSDALKPVLADQRGYYLIGYRPTEQTFKGKQFHSIKVRVRRPGFNVRTRTGFYSLPDSDNSPRSLKGDRQLYAALASPLGGGDVRMQLTSFFGHDARSGSFLRSLLHINAQDITFSDEPNGFKKVVLDVAAVTFGESGGVADEFNRTHTVRMGPDTFRHVMLNGLSYSADVPVKQAGAYQLRVVVRDAASGRFGTSGQFVEVPNIGKKQFALSGLVVGEADTQGGAPSLPPGATAEAALSPVPSNTHLSLRRFRPGMSLAYSYVIYNPRLERPATRPQLTTQARLFHEGREIFTSPEAPFDASAQTDPARLLARGTLRLPPNAAPGNYVLQMIVNDVASGKKRQTSTQWIDFDIIR